MTRVKAVWIFLGTIAITVGGLLLFIQSRHFAEVLKQFARRYAPVDLGVEGDFRDLAVKLIPPGVVIRKPAVVFKEKNPVGLPAGTRLDAEFIDVTFQFFQLLTGAVTINAFAVHGADLKLELDEKFFAAREKALQPRKKSVFPQKLSMDSLVRLNFRSVSLVDSRIDVRAVRSAGSQPLRVQAYAKELTVGRSTVDRMPSYDLAIDLQKAFVELPSFQYALAQFQASVEVSASGASVRNLGLQQEELNLHTNGNITGNLLAPKTLTADLAYIVRGPVRKWFDKSLLGRFVRLPKGTEVDGNITVEGKLTADLMDFVSSLETKVSIQVDDARFDAWRAERVLLKSSWKDGVTTVESTELALGEGSVRLGKLVFDSSRKEQELAVRAEFRDADFRRLLGPALKAVYPLHMRLTGSAEADVLLGGSVGVRGSADLALADFSFDNQKFGVKKPLKVLLASKSIGLKSRFAFGPDGVKFDQTELTMPNTRLKAAGKVDEKHGFDIDVSGPVNMRDIGKLGAFDIGGEGQLHWTIKGKKPEVLFGFEADLKDAHYLNLNLGNVKGKIVYNDGSDIIAFQNLSAVQGRTEFIANGFIDLGDRETADMVIQVPRGTIQDFASVFSLFLKQSVPWYPYELTGQMNGVIKVSGKTPLDQLSVEGDMEVHNVDYLHEIFRYGRMHAGYRRGAYVAEDVEVRKKGGWLRGGMSYSSDGVLDFSIRSDGLSTLDIDRLAALGIPYRAPLALEASGSGKLGSLKSQFLLALGDGVIKAYSVPRTEFGFRTEGGRLKGDLSVFGGQLKGRLDYGWEKGLASTFDVDANRLDFQPVVVALNSELADDPELDSEVTGAAHLKFQTGALSRLTGSIALESYRLARKGYSLALAEPVRIAIENGNYAFDGLKFIGDGTSLSAKGGVRDGNIHTTFAGNLNLGIFEFLVGEIASVRGSAEVRAEVLGRAEDPSFRAEVVAQESSLRMRAIEQPFEDLKFKVDWIDSTMQVKDIGARFADGHVRGFGRVQLYPYRVPDLDFKFELDNPKPKVYPVAFARVSGKLGVSGSELPYKVKGSVFVAEALIKENFSLSEGSRILKSSKFLPQKKGGGPGEFQVFDLDVDISADRNIFVRNDLFDAELRGNIKVIHSIQTPRLLGQATVLHGKLLFKDNYFAVQSGNLRFTNPSAIDPEFDLTGQTEMKGYKITLLSSGSVSDYKLSFQSQPPLSEKDIVNLLTLGVTSGEYQSIARENRDAYSRDEMYGLLFSQSGVNRGLQEKLGVKLRVDQTQTQTPENVFRARGTGDATESISPKVVVQKQVTSKLNASLGSTVGVGDNQERNADLELGLTKHMSVLGTYEDQRGPQLRQQRTSVGADLKFKLRFK